MVFSIKYLTGVFKHHNSDTSYMQTLRLGDIIPLVVPLYDAPIQHWATEVELSCFHSLLVLYCRIVVISVRILIF